MSESTTPSAIPASAPPGGTPAGRGDRHFRTDHLASDLVGRSVRGGAVTLASQGVKFVLQVGSTMVLARLLTPADFGLIAMVSAVTGFVALFRDLGLSMATLQRAEITHAQVSTLFWINVALSVLLSLVVACLAPVVAWAYGEPRLALITVALASTFVFGGLAAQHQALLRRQMRFGALALIEIVPMAVGIAMAVLLALSGAGYWALVGMAATTAAATAAAAWAASRWRPGKPSWSRDVREMIAFGGNLTGFHFTNYFGRNADQALIGWSAGPGPVGLYSKAYGLLMMPLVQILGPMGSVALPVLSRLQGQPEEFRRYYLRAIQLLAYGTLPLITLMGVTSAEIVHFLLGPQWAEAGRIFTLLAIAALFQPIFATAGWIHTSLGRTDRLLRWGLMSDPLYVLSFVVGLPWGPTGVALSYAICVNLLFLPGMAYAFKPSAVRLRDFLSAIWRPAALSGVLFLAAAGTRSIVAGSGPAALLSACLGAATLAFAASVILWRRVRTDVLGSVGLLAHLRSSPRC
jgi:PST family polysaccharide transporter